MSRQFWHKIFGLLVGLFSVDSGGFRGRGGEGALSTIGRGSSGVLEAHRGTIYMPTLVMPPEYGAV